MKHYGDITKISGYEAPIVDVITGGSPCQDLSVAGKRAGLAGERSGLFMEQIRIVREMRERDERDNGRTAWAVRPRYMVWENVPGAFSSGTPKGADFAAVLEEIIKVAEPGTSVQVPVPDGGWTKSGCYYSADGRWSVAWRVHDAQFWGVPQRRKRIALVADFGGLTAPEILFERKGLSGNSEPGGASGQGTAGAAGEGVEDASCYGLDHVMLSGGTTYQGRGYYDNVSGCLKTQPHGVCDTISFQERGGKPGGGKGILIQHEHVGALSTLNNQSVLAYGISSYDSNAMKSPNPHSGIYEADTARTLDLNGGSPACNQGGIAVVQSVGCDVYNQEVTGEVAASLTAASGGEGGNQKPCVFDARGNGDGDSIKANLVSNAASIVRRLTPNECERLQGFPDGWTDIGDWTDSKGKKHKDADSPRYKALGNSIALPFWQYLARRICAQYERNITMASLFDGIGGFPLVFQRCGAIPVWASEIEEFPIAVTKKHFPEKEE